MHGKDRKDTPHFLLLTETLWYVHLTYLTPRVEFLRFIACCKSSGYIFAHLPRLQALS